MSGFAHGLLVRADIRAVMLALTRTSVRGAEHLPRHGAGIVVSNHIAAVDPGILVGALARPIVLMSKAENYSRPAPEAVYAPWSALHRPAARRSPGTQRAEQVLRGGRLLCLFPEGTRSRDGH